MAAAAAQVQLSAYPDCIGGDLKGLSKFVTEHLGGVVGGVHVLPFYPSSADRGFAPLTYKEARPVARPRSRPCLQDMRRRYVTLVDGGSSSPGRRAPLGWRARAFRRP